MKRIYVIVLTLILSLIMLIPAALPAAAAAPDNSPVAWVSSASNSSNSPFGHISQAVSVKLLADGSTVGKFMVHDFSGNLIYRGDTINQAPGITRFHSLNGASIAEFEVLVRQEPAGVSGWSKIVYVDNGEPGGYADCAQWWLWLPDLYPGAPPMWWPTAGPQDPGDPNFGTPQPVNNGNIQIHLDGE